MKSWPESSNVQLPKLHYSNVQLADAALQRAAAELLHYSNVQLPMLHYSLREQEKCAGMFYSTCRRFGRQQAAETPLQLVWTKCALMPSADAIKLQRIARGFESQARRVARKRRPARTRLISSTPASDANDRADANLLVLWKSWKKGNRVAAATAGRSILRSLRLAAFAVARQEILTGSLGPHFDIYDEEEDADAYDINTENMAYLEELRTELYFDDRRTSD